ncbi:hypothetical protein KI387_000584, partial [Taxus chinensis]
MQNYPSSSYGRGRGFRPRHFPFLFPEEEEQLDTTSVTKAPTCTTETWLHIKALVQEEESASNHDNTEEAVEWLIMEKAYDQYDAEHQAE